MVARLQQREKGGGLSRDPARERYGSATTFEVRHALLEHGDGRVHDPGVRVAVLLQVEIGRGRFRVFKYVAGGLENRHGASPRIGVGPLARVQLPGLEAEGAGLLGLGRTSIGRLLGVGHSRAPAPARKRRICGVCCASSSKKESWPYGASITWHSTGLPSARSARSISRDPAGG